MSRLRKSATVVMPVFWAITESAGDASSVDVAWAYAVGGLAIAYAALSEGYAVRRILVGLLGAVWAFRLGTFLLVDRVLRAEGEDGRYRMLRESWGPSASRNFFYFFQAQALFVFVFAGPVYQLTQFLTLLLIGA